MSGSDALVRAIAEGIERYLEQHPDAADSAEGICAWWLTPPLGADALPAVLASLAELEARGVVVRTEMTGMATIYSSAMRGRGSLH